MTRDIPLIQSVSNDKVISAPSSVPQSFNTPPPPAVLSTSIQPRSSLSNIQVPLNVIIPRSNSLKKISESEKSLGSGSFSPTSRVYGSITRSSYNSLERRTSSSKNLEQSSIHSPEKQFVGLSRPLPISDKQKGSSPLKVATSFHQPRIPERESFPITREHTFPRPTQTTVPRAEPFSPNEFTPSSGPPAEAMKDLTIDHSRRSSTSRKRNLRDEQNPESGDDIFKNLDFSNAPFPMVLDERSTDTSPRMQDTEQISDSAPSPQTANATSPLMGDEQNPSSWNQRRESSIHGIQIRRPTHVLRTSTSSVASSFNSAGIGGVPIIPASYVTAAASPPAYFYTGSISGTPSSRYSPSRADLFGTSPSRSLSLKQTATLPPPVMITGSAMPPSPILPSVSSGQSIASGGALAFLEDLERRFQGSMVASRIEKDNEPSDKPPMNLKQASPFLDLAFLLIS